MKTNNVLQWFVVDKNGYTVVTAKSRRAARGIKNVLNITFSKFGPHRIAKVVVTK